MMSTMKVIPLSAVTVESLAEVVAELHGQSLSSGPVSMLGDREFAESAVATAIWSRPGVVAVEGSSVVGFMVAPLANIPGSTIARLRSPQHAARPACVRSAYRLMYAALAERLVAAGCTYHSVPFPLGVPAAVDAFFELELGVDQITGAVPIADYEASAGSDDIRAATVDDLDGLVALSIELTKFHSRAPMFQPALLDVRTVRRSLVRALEDDASTVLVVDRGGQLRAMMSAEPDGAYADSVVIGMNVVTESARSAGLGTAMLDVLVCWAAGHGYRHCTVGWTSSNPISDAFYRSRGFVPIRYRLHRRIDPRVAWANDALDYRSFS